MIDMTDLLESVETKNSLKDIDNKFLYLKLKIEQDDYLLLLSDIIEIKNTNLITPADSLSLKKQHISGTFYYRHEIIPVYQLIVKHEDKGAKIILDVTDIGLEPKKYYNLLILNQDSYMGFIITGNTHYEIIDINFAQEKKTTGHIANIANLEILDIKHITNQL